MAAIVCKPFRDETATAVERFDRILLVLQNFFDCLTQKGLNLSTHKCSSERQQLTT